MLLQGKEPLGPRVLEERHGTHPSVEPPGEAWPCGRLDVGLLAPRTVNSHTRLLFQASNRGTSFGRSGKQYTFLLI